MADETGQETVPARLRKPLAEWLEAQSGEHSRDEVLNRLLAAYRAVEGDGDVAPVDSDRVDDIEDRLQVVEGDVDEKIEDVRRRVVQVKREADEKAPADHDHSDLRERARSAAETASATEDAIESLRSRMADVEATTEEGFENYEEILEYLTDETDDLDRKLGTLANAVVTLRDRLERVAAADGRRRAVEDLRRSAATDGIRTADCEECGATVDVALLTEPACPHCQHAFEDVEPRSGFFGTATLVTGDPPALDPGEDEGGLAEGLEAIADDAEPESETETDD